MFYKWLYSIQHFDSEIYVARALQQYSKVMKMEIYTQTNEYAESGKNGGTE